MSISKIKDGTQNFNCGSTMKVYEKCLIMMLECLNNQCPGCGTLYALFSIIIDSFNKI